MSPVENSKPLSGGTITTDRCLTYIWDAAHSESRTGESFPPDTKRITLNMKTGLETNPQARCGPLTLVVTVCKSRSPTVFIFQSRIVKRPSVECSQPAALVFCFSLADCLVICHPQQLDVGRHAEYAKLCNLSWNKGLNEKWKQVGIDSYTTWSRGWKEHIGFEDWFPTPSSWHSLRFPHTSFSTHTGGGRCGSGCGGPFTKQKVPQARH